MSRSSHARGRWAEDLAATDYEREGYEILHRNWRSPVRARRGEIDLICRRGGTIVFCEVKARRDDSHGDAGFRVDASKQAQVRSIAELWLVEAGIDLDRVGIRFDVVAVNNTTLTRFEAAF